MTFPGAALLLTVLAFNLLGDAIRGDTSLFTQDDCVEAAWRVVDPVLQVGLPVLADEGLPLGLQVTGFIDGDAETFAAAAAIQTLFR